jgi:uncharacterized protein (DUF885 family)
MFSYRPAIVCLALAVSACGGPESDTAPAPAADERVRTIADSYLEAYFDRNPDQVTYYGLPGRRHDRLPDNSLEALKAWHAKQDAWLADLRGIDPSAIGDRPLRATYAIVRETLEGSAGARVCETERWSVSQMTGWHVDFGYLVTIQPVGSSEARKDALARWAALPGYIDTEIANLRDGLAAGYSSPQANVRIVVDQMNALSAAAASDLPFLSPSQRDQDPEFQKAFSALVRERLLPAFTRYRDFLEKEYLPKAREAIAVSANPNGAACYDASVRAYSSLQVPAEEVHRIGLQQIEQLTAEMRTIAERSFNTTDIKTLMQTLRTDRRYMFKSREELIGYSEAALARAKAAAPGWFGLLPKADVRIEPYPKYREKNAPNEYNAPAEDGSRPGLFLISAYEAEKKSRAPNESTAFHETIPGHHFQIAIAMERKGPHPIGRYIFNSGYVEGWALYAERLADEMKLYSSDLDRLGMLSSQAFRASRLVVDSGMHRLGWTRQQAIDYMLEHTAEEDADAAAEIDRYIVWPGQATSYMLGMLEIRRARSEAERALGARFDIKAFHDRVLEDGGVPLAFMTDKIKEMITQ